MKGSGLKYLFYISSLLLLVIMIVQSRNAAVSCDEVLHNQQSEAVYQYFATCGADQSALNTPVSHLKYYGQSYDGLATIFIKWFGIEDIYRFRHIMSAVAGWLAVFITALFAMWLGDIRTAIIVLFLFAVSPPFIGHAQNNLKDVPFALGYISSLFFTLRIIFSHNRPRPADLLMLILSLAFALSIRAGGLLLFCYLFFFFLAGVIYKYFTEGKADRREIGTKFLLLVLISGASYFLGILLWPYALVGPFRNVLDSLRIMSHFPDTFRQIFGGRSEWSDFMPWYYLPKSMLITIPVVVLSGFVIFFAFSKKIVSSGKAHLYAIILFAILFPVIYAIAGKSNLYSSWRQFLFVFPPIVILSATGLSNLIGSFERKYLRIILLVALGILAVHPVRFMNHNHRYFYLYYNQITGGLRGAFGNYETDYYYLGQTEASEWLIDYINKSGFRGPLKVGATYSVSWQFRDRREISTFYMRNEERSMYDWDYAIITNRYIPPAQLKEGKWPPREAIHVVYADSVPICAVLARKSRDDYYGCQALKNGEAGKAIQFFKSALAVNNQDEMIFYNLAAALVKEGYIERADSVLRDALKINPDSEPVLMYLGNINTSLHRSDEAKSFYMRLISINRKYYEAYVRLAGLMGRQERKKARTLLMDCLNINPKYKPAIEALANTYRQSDPEVAKKYDELANKIK